MWVFTVGKLNRPSISLFSECCITFCFTLTAVSAFAQFMETKLPSKTVAVDYCLGFWPRKSNNNYHNHKQSTVYKYTPVIVPGGRVHSVIWPKRVSAAEQGMVFRLFES